MANNDWLVNFGSHERRRTKIKLALVAAAAHKIETKAFEDIAVRELCDAVSISETSFYSYFSRKPELLAYCVHLWILEIQLRAARAVQGRVGLVMIGELFEQVDRHVQGRPGLTGEMIAFLAKRREEHEAPPTVSSLERQMAFPEFPGIDDFEAQPIEDVLKHHLQLAIERGELPGHTRVEAVASALASLFFGAPVAFRAKPRALDQTYRRQVNLLLMGAKGIQRRTVESVEGVPSLYRRRAP